MAHVQKYTKGNVQGLSIHWDRKTENHSNPDIDNERSDLNYDLCEKEGDTLSRMNERLSEVHSLNRNDLKVCADWIVTLPENLKGASEQEQRQFFEKTYEFLTDRYGGEKNILSANVHNDETTPHMHFAFMPVVWDEKKQREKVSAKEVLTRKDLRTFHQDLDEFFKKELPHIYKGGILNDKTIGVDTVKDLKKHS
ncbi:MobV family relaxase, partial [Bacillus proteolyticus]